MNKLIVTLAATALLVAARPVEEPEWPRAIDTVKGKLVVYQPQVDSFEDDLLEARAAISLTAPREGASPVFGAVWFSARLETDRDARSVTVRSIEVPQARFPDATPEEQRELTDFLAAEMSSWELEFALDELVADLELGDSSFTTAGLEHAPPRIILSTEPAVLVQIDGEPILQPIEATGLQSVVNTPFPIVYDRSTETWYLFGGGELWYSARACLGPWEVAAQVPDFVRKLASETQAPASTAQGPASSRGVVSPGVEAPDTSVASLPPPAIVVATEPTELIVCTGKPSWTPVDDLDLLYLDNSDGDVFLDINSQRYYVLLAGRWYRAPAVEGELDWEHVPNDTLPPSFSRLAPDSPTGNVLAHVAGTRPAREAALDTLIPQTAAVRRDDTSLQVEYDGAPQFVEVDGLAAVEYAVNTPSAVFLVGGEHYCCDQGVWYVAGSALGPWRVASEVPAVIYELPTSNPHYNVVYVRIYDVRPEVVYVGYTPGYLGCYYYHGCVVYGTGLHYRPWYGSRYYPRSWTWGLRVTYDPWWGWGAGLGFGYGPFWYSPWWGYRDGWYGVGGYRPHWRPPIGRGRPALYAGDRPRPSTLPSDRGNVYDRDRSRERLAPRPATSDQRSPALAADFSNDVLTDRAGNVYRRDQNGDWQQRDRGNWRPADDLDRPQLDAPSWGGRAPSTLPSTPTPSTRPSPGTWPSPSTRPSPSTQPYPSRSVPSTRPSMPSAATRPQLERDRMSRSRGAQLSSSFGRSFGGSRGGGSRAPTPATRGRR